MGREVKAALGHHGHGLHAHAQKRIAHAGLDLRRRNVHGLHGRAAEAVDGHAAHFGWQARQQADDARQVVALCRLGVGAAQDHVFQQGGVQVNAFQETFDHLRGQVVRAHRGQRAFLGKVEGGTGISGDDCFHGGFLG